MKRVTLIVGAGATKDLHPNFGLGSDLILEIEKGITTNRDLIHYFLNIEQIDFGILQTFQNNLNHYRQESKFKSIDEFLTEVEIYPEFFDWKVEYSLIGRLSILYHITGWEAHYKNSFEVENIKHTWIQKIIDFIETEGLLDIYLHDKTIHSSLKILTFNYDRVLEYSLIKYYEKKGTNYTEAVKNWIQSNVAHVYDDLILDDLEFGHTNNDLFHLNKFINKIKIAYDRRGFQIARPLQIPNTPQILDATYYKDSVSGDPILGTIGFGFDFFNCRNINLTKRRSKTIANIITLDKIGSFENRRALTNQIRNMLENIEFKYMECKNFLDYLFQQNEDES